MSSPDKSRIAEAIYKTKSGASKQVTISPMGANSSRNTALNNSKDLHFEVLSANTMKDARDQKRGNLRKSPDAKGTT